MKHIKRIFAALAAILMVAVGLQLVGVSAASAHINEETLSCSAWSVNLTNYSPSQAASTTYQRYSYNLWLQWLVGPPSGSTPISDPSQWNADSKPYDGSPVNTVLHQDGGFGSYFYWESTTVPAKTNHVRVTIDNVVKDNQDFSASFSDSGTLTDTQAHTMHLVVAAWDNPQYNVDKTIPVNACVQLIGLPAAPVPNAPSCTQPGLLVVPAPGNHITWTQVNASTVKASADQGYRFTDGSSSKTFTENVLPQLTGDICATKEIPVQPTITQIACTGPGTHDSGSFTAPADTAEIHYTVNGKVVTALAQSGFKFVSSQLNGYTWVDSHTATFTVSYNAAPNCTQDITPVAPSVTQATCDHSTGVDSGFTVTPATTKGVTYTVSDDQLTVTATFGRGYRFGKPLPAGWVSGPNHTATFTVTQSDPMCLINTAPVNPTVTHGVCDTTTGQDSDYTVKLPESSDAVTYSNDDLVVTATLGDGYQWGDLPDGWTLNEDGTAQFTLTVTQPDCAKVVVPTNTPSVTPSTPSPSTSASSTSLAVAAAQATTANGQAAKGLSNTGAGNIGKGIVLGSVLLIAGLGFVLFGRRRMARGH
jgi:hypothetical protein